MFLVSDPLGGVPARLEGFLRAGRGSAGAVLVPAALAVTALAAWLPARRAVRLDLLEALSAE